KASDLVCEANRRGETFFKPYELTSSLKKNLEAIEKDNNFIYNDRVPDFGTLERPGKASIAKVIQFQSPASNFLDLFTNLVPLPISHAMSNYNSKKDALVSEELEKLRNTTSSLNENLASNNLPTAIEDTGSNAVPDSIKEKSQGIREQGGIQSLEDKLY
ncbi:PREDICTED: programmed cell death 6-interacting protein-like, partial [Amphimedon queenslandica]|uniref:BRO1 domain-containing protein n=2 Tax=Amphimedon queenslandica TaxID=400682 RepID=A0AAN0K466_AMPQE